MAAFFHFQGFDARESESPCDKRMRVLACDGRAGRCVYTRVTVLQAHMRACMMVVQLHVRMRVGRSPGHACVRVRVTVVQARMLLRVTVVQARLRARGGIVVVTRRFLPLES